jgi:tripartite ATP-independent transporter DctP family solute receptor
MEEGMFKKMMMTALVVVIVNGMAFATGSRQTEGGQQKYLLKAGTVLTENDPLYQGLLLFQKNVMERTKGNVEVQVFPSSQLGSDEDVIEQARVGTNVSVTTEAGRLSAYVPEFAIFGAPYLINSTAEIDKVLGTAAFKELAAKLEQQGLHVLSYNWFQGERHLFTKIPVSKPADVRGVRIRSMGTPVANFTLEAMGGNPVALPWSEAYQGLQTKAVDAVEVHYSAAIGASIPEVTSYLQKTAHFYLMTGLVCSQKWFESLPAEYQKIISEEAYNGGAAATKGVIDNDAKFEKQLTDAGLKINPIDKQSFVDACAGVYDKLGLGELKRRIDREIGR